MRNPAMWYSENPEMERALEHAAALREDWALANGRRIAHMGVVAADRQVGRGHGIRLAIGQAAVAIGRAIGGPDLDEDGMETESSLRKAA